MGRTAWAGFSPNRIWKGPKALAAGNSEDPDGLCGDASVFMSEAFYKECGDDDTTDGFTLARILWNGTVGNPIAMSCC